jgi:hypothetical protein
MQTERLSIAIMLLLDASAGLSISLSQVPSGVYKRTGPYGTKTAQCQPFEILIFVQYR